MNLYDSHVDAGQELTPRQREQYYRALIEYVRYGVEPDLTGPPAAVFKAIKPTLEISKKRADAGATKSHQKQNQTDNKTANKTESKDESSAEQTTEQTEIKTGNKPASNDGTNGVTKNKNKNIYKEKDLPIGKSEKKPFSPPSVDEVREYIEQHGYDVDAERFFDFYTSKGWMVGKTKMKDWKAAVRNWHRTSSEQKNPRKEVEPDAESGEYATWL